MLQYFFNFPMANYVICGSRYREFRVILRNDPSSIFSSNVEIENTSGPIHYDINRVYTGTLEGNEPFAFYFIFFSNSFDSVKLPHHIIDKNREKKYINSTITIFSFFFLYFYLFKPNNNNRQRRFRCSWNID